MITNISIDRWNEFTVETDDNCIKQYPLTKVIKQTSRVWNYKIKKPVNVSEDITVNYYERETENGYVFKYTQLPIILNQYVIWGLLSVEDYHKYMEEFKSPRPPEYPNELPVTLGKMSMRDDQMEALNKLMSSRFGLCHVCTGFGKTEMIAYMCYFYTKVLKWNVLITAPNAKVLDEITVRVNDRLGTKIGVNYPNDSGVLAINAASVSKQKYSHHDYADYLSTIKVILSDECEACLSNTHHQIYDYCRNRECMYGFSATPDCYCGNLDITKGVTNEAFRCKHLLSTFGGSLVNLVPSGFEINIINVNLPWWRCSDDLLQLGNKFIQSGCDVSILPVNFRVLIDNELFKQDKLALVFKKLAADYPHLMITINRTEIIDYWVSRLPDLKIIEVSGRGYIYRYMGESKKLSMESLKSSYLSADLILGSKSLMRGVDLPELHNSIQLSGSKSGSTIQSIGRTARKKLMNIIILKPKMYIYGISNNNKTRVNLIYSQYPKELNKISESSITIDM